ncbi:DnaJ domain-containing protein [Colletotrichum orchidophilum]|uniref:DnaJ domain-containing protein n=1 Tax=Colletotrichum orchidophilum TaxID=1209926 RepID=A0A1G4BKP7_9PEZI|nr:DnaJ domain-containing protein [Colletotrichum orchidophilum]OHF01994.1 DnaJ domain-containing protein [Colletotrichum orchidophilum]
MILKTSPAFAICSSNNVLNLFAVPAHHTSITSPPTRRPSNSSDHPASRHTRLATSRSYATVNQPPHNGSNTSKSRGNSSKTGSPWPTCANPTPYDIFAIDKAAPYTKARFAELVKQYHPDRHHATALDSLPPQTRLERYRLIVLANEILSSPDKRRAYDAWGLGWHLPGTGAEDTRDINEIYRRADKAWRHEAGNPAMNATWEDWERWHDRQANGERQKPMYMSNASFAALVLAALAVGTVAQTTRMDNSTATFLEKKNAHEANISEALRRQGQAVAGKGREERIERFVRERENINFGFMPSKLDVRPAAPSPK